MSNLLFILLILTIFSISESAKIRPKSDLSIIDGQGFVAYLEEEVNYGAISKCWFKYQDEEKIEIDLKSNDSIHTGRGEIIQKFSPTECGIRVSNANNASIGTWNLQAMNYSEIYVNDSVKIRILKAPKMTFSTTVAKPLGLNTVSCTKQDYTRACKLIETRTNESWNQCELFTQIKSDRNFECRTLSWGSMNESIEKISVRIANSTQYSEGSIEETEDHYVLRCVMKSTSVGSCRAEMPDRITQLYVADGLNNGKYSSYDTLLSQSKCALEIRKPLEQSENGLWKIIQHSDSGALGTTGCLFYVGTSSKEAIIKEELKRQQYENNTRTWSNPQRHQQQQQQQQHKQQKLKTMTMKEDEYEDKDPTTQLRRRRIELYSTESTISEITCMVPFVVDDCYLRDSKNTVHFPDSGRFQRSRALGICTFINVHSMPGLWSCGLRGSDYKDDVVQDIEVFIESKLGRMVTGDIRIALREPLELMCISPFEEPISKCVYVSPSSQVHIVASDSGGIKMKGHVQYFGDGITKGFCGMRIDAVKENDFGEWSCQFQVVNNGATLSNFTISVTETVPASSSSMPWYAILGIFVGALVIALLSTGAAIFGYKKFRKTTNSNSEQVEAIGMSVRE